MKPNHVFLNKAKSFWAHVRLISQEVGYTEKGRGIIKVPTVQEIEAAYSRRGLATSWLTDSGHPDHSLREQLLEYFEYRSAILNKSVEPVLMDRAEARQLFQKVRKSTRSALAVPMNKQKKEKKKPAYFTALVNMLVEANGGGIEFNPDPRSLTTIVRDRMPVRTLTRRVDGTFPATGNPIAVWEVKEYYYTTTFGSRVADGVYETLLDGMELEDLKSTEDINVLHYLFVDSHFTWWECGRSYLCRIIDMLHMGYVDEVMFGKEIITELPKVVRTWVAQLKQ